MSYKLILALSLLIITGFSFIRIADQKDWPEYNGDGARSHYSTLDQINTQNVGKLKIAWTYASGGADTVGSRTQIQCNPIIINGILYGVSADIQAFALDAATGREIWKTEVTDNSGTLSRGVTHWEDGDDKRIFFGAGKWLNALDARTGKLIESFGENGRINLLNDIQRPGSDEYIKANTPNTIYKNLIITGARVNENETSLLGDIRAFDTRTGRKIWTFHTIPAKGEAGYETWAQGNPRAHIGGANAWAGMAIDRQRGIVYIPTGSAAYDFYGGNRLGNNLYANCLLALDAATGKKLWHYQLVHHDIWDRDPPSPPNLLTITHKGKAIDVVSLVTKQGHIFVFDRVTGKPVFPITERPFSSAGAVPGEKPSPTQPIPTLPVPFTRQGFTEKDLSPFVADRDSIVKIIRKSKSGSPYIPIGFDRTIFFPGTDGGAQWGGAATDPEGIIYIPAKEIPVYTSLIKKQETKGKELTGNKLYQLYCAACHGADRMGNHDGSYPSLAGISKRLTEPQIRDLLAKGRGMMPSFTHISEAERKGIIDFISDKQSSQAVSVSAKSEVPYQHTGYNRWYDSNGYPISQPPWGTLTAVDMNTGQRRWQIPLGEYPELTKKGIPPTGTDNYGGPLVTGGGLIFIAASRDEQFRVIDKKTGRILWSTRLPAAGYASPSTYMLNGKQYVVIACGGGKLNTKSGDKYLAFCLD
ncbi:Outer membrane protein assembly factor BamB [Dyadobacter sp. CECT 9275]|uniref:Outer membrane protein assembly factor BamB n=1 Tax=Dyadobacter helix TaxID=2822344 RepID=A0A916JDU6_9BACT|nr:PQQ-binding-like beta-propeller repeat protein [Dyadobacter sp. CECT 9275]CAG5004197.1 Outer membrane protein assembly factor BamB [Dyadobacter sp. CECT 9275]